MKLSFRGWLTIITLVLLTVVVISAWPEIKKAWDLLGQVDLWILLLLLPIQLASYYATGGMIFSYLRAKGNVKDMGRWSMARLALELNFVNHILPSGGAAGFSYLAWVLSRHKVSASRSTMAQIKPGTPVVLAVPAWKDKEGRFSHLPLIDNLNELGFEQVKFETVPTEQLLYYRPDQVVARELLVLTKS